jgi:hypothetical protein
MPKNREGDGNSDEDADSEEQAPFDYSISGEKVPEDFFRDQNPDFRTLFAQKADEDYEEGDFFLSPRMAHKLFCTALLLSDNFKIYEDLGSVYYHLKSDGYPKVCWPFFRKKRWVEAYSECYRRIAARLAKVRFSQKIYGLFDNVIVFCDVGAVRVFGQAQTAQEKKWHCTK